MSDLYQLNRAVQSYKQLSRSHPEVEQRQNVVVQAAIQLIEDLDIDDAVVVSAKQWDEHQAQSLNRKNTIYNMNEQEGKLMARIAELEADTKYAMKYLTPSPLIGLREAVDQYVANHLSAEERIAELKSELAESQRLHDAGGSREADLLARAAELERDLEQVRKTKDSATRLASTYKEKAAAIEQQHAALVQAVLGLEDAVHTYKSKQYGTSAEPAQYTHTIDIGKLNKVLALARQDDDATTTSDDVIEDGCGSGWVKCKREGCGLHVVRPGRSQCECDHLETLDKSELIDMLMSELARVGELEQQYAALVEAVRQSLVEYREAPAQYPEDDHYNAGDCICEIEALVAPQDQPEGENPSLIDDLKSLLDDIDKADEHAMPSSQSQYTEIDTGLWGNVAIAANSLCERIGHTAR